MNGPIARDVGSLEIHNFRNVINNEEECNEIVYRVKKKKHSLVTKSCHRRKWLSVKNEIRRSLAERYLLSVPLLLLLLLFKHTYFLHILVVVLIRAS